MDASKSGVGVSQKKEDPSCRLELQSLREHEAPISGVCIVQLLRPGAYESGLAVASILTARP
jgi:hypothetical protein